MTKQQNFGKDFDVTDGPQAFYSVPDPFTGERPILRPALPFCKGAWEVSNGPNDFINEMFAMILQQYVASRAPWVQFILAPVVRVMDADNNPKQVKSAVMHHMEVDAQRSYFLRRQTVILLANVPTPVFIDAPDHDVAIADHQKIVKMLRRDIIMTVMRCIWQALEFEADISYGTRYADEISRWMDEADDTDPGIKALDFKPSHETRLNGFAEFAIADLHGTKIPKHVVEPDELDVFSYPASRRKYEREFYDANMGQLGRKLAFLRMPYETNPDFQKCGSQAA